VNDIKLFSLRSGAAEELPGDAVVLEITLRSRADLERAKPFFQQSYEAS